MNEEETLKFLYRKIECVDSTRLALTIPMEENVIEIKVSLNNLKKIYRMKNQFKNEFKKIESNLDIEINKAFNTAIFLSLIKEIQNEFGIEIPDSIRKKLSKDYSLVFAIKKMSSNSIFLRSLDFKFIGIEFVRDTDEQDYDILTIYISINEKNMDKLLDIRDNIIQEMCKDLSIEDLEKISIVNILSE